ncbi:MAG: hypothetical protein IKB07_10435 [Lachnospiraceae bacterium]|nr:hypothetical protein [Lachnospiraceae bacterium]
MKRLFLGLLGFFLLAFAACGSKEPELPPYGQGNKEEFEQFLTEIMPQEDPWTEEELQTYESYLQPKGFEHVFSEEEIKELFKSKKNPKSVTSQQAAEDVTLAFELLSYVYGGYHYFGGDEVFFPIRDSILAKLTSMKEIQTNDLWELLWEGLSPVIADNHFELSTDQRGIYAHERDYSQSTYFVRDLYFDDPTGVDPQYVKRTIGPEGALTYCLATVCKSPENLPTTMTIEGVEHPLSWHLAQPTVLSSSKEKKVFSETTMADGRLPVLQNYSFGGSDKKMNEFAATGTSYKEEPLFVLDLRGNLGGNDGYAHTWIKNFCGKDVIEKELWSAKITTSYTVANGGFVNANGGVWRTSESDGTLWETDNLIFVLIDNNTASSGESFTNMLTLGKRVILVGTNTMGCLNFGNANKLYLPNSGIMLRLGANCSFYQSLDKTEGIGYSPDLWVEPSDSLDAVVRLCHYYGLYEESVYLDENISNTYR